MHWHGVLCNITCTVYLLLPGVRSIGDRPGVPYTLAIRMNNRSYELLKGYPGHWVVDTARSTRVGHVDQ